MSITPPIPLRDEAAICLFGDVKARKTNGADLTKLMSPPVSVPNPYGWMRSDKRDSQKVLDHLAIENKYTVESQSHLESLRTSIYNSMLSKITETDFTAPTPNGRFCYYTRTFAGKSYKVHCRAPRDSSTLQPCNVSNDPSKPVMEGEVVLLDENVLAEGKSYCSVGTCKPSPDGSKLAYSLDTVGGETYDIFVVDIATGEVVDDSVKEVDAAVLWGDDVSIYFNRMDEEHRPYKTMRHTLKTDPSADELLFTEPDALFWLSLGKSQDGEYIFIESASKETSEVNFVHLKSKSKSKLGCVAARRSKVLYEVESRNGRFYISTNVGGTPNFHLVSCPAEANCEDKWEPVTFAGERIFDGENSRVLDGVCCLKSHMICYGREEGMPQIFVAKFDDGTDNVGAFERLEFDEDVYDVRGFKNLEYDTDKLWITYESMTTPQKTLKVDLAAGGRDLVKETVVSGYDPSEYECKRLEVLSRDGKTKIPCSMVWKKSLRKAEGTPQHVHLYGYGSYGACIEADFRSTRLALLDKGMIFVIAHIRGGGELGRGWYEMPNGAKYKCKKNTFYDFVDVAKSLVDSGMTEPAKLSAEGRSAGGLLMGASINLEPALFRAAIYGVPFVDVAVTMCDCSIPLTVVEWEEWGNPNEKEFFDYMMEYSPMQNVVTDGDYPACLLTGGLHDPRVAYWEPMKMAAEIRHQKAKNGNKKPILLKIDMAAGHFSASDRYKYLKELSFEYAFLLDAVGL